MQDCYYAIGETAGKIYQYLTKNGSVTMTALQKEIPIFDEPLFNQALGWLAREDKIDFRKVGKTTKISLLERPNPSV